jgi:anaerobic dimethyl sulfoxide reductase subunit B (iron-sulfur subunit)
MHKDADTGLVSVDAAKCIGCGYCHMACPYNAPKVDRSVGHSVKCDGCTDRVAAGLAPICVGACPLRALAFGPAEEMAVLGERAAIAPLPEPRYTNPNLYIKSNPDAKPAGSTDGAVRNLLEVM